MTRLWVGLLGAIIGSMIGGWIGGLFTPVLLGLMLDAVDAENPFSHLLRNMLATSPQMLGQILGIIVGVWIALRSYSRFDYIIHIERRERE